MRRTAPTCAAVAFTLMATSSRARADEHEAVLTLRPTMGSARVPENGTAERPVVGTRGLTGSLVYGQRDWLDLGGELSVNSFEEAAYSAVRLPIAGTLMMGPLWRSTRAAQLRGVAVLRFGARWIPTVQVGLGVGARYLSAASFLVPTVQGERLLIPDGHDEEITIDIVTSARVGFEVRLSPSWIAGVAVGASHAFGMSTPYLQTAEGTIAISRVWYPH